nr:MAG TPA: hypothetical protein [Caudoviricetes sp.]
MLRILLKKVRLKLGCVVTLSINLFKIRIYA